MLHSYIRLRTLGWCYCTWVFKKNIWYFSDSSSPTTGKYSRHKKKLHISCFFPYKINWYNERQCKLIRLLVGPPGNFLYSLALVLFLLHCPIKLVLGNLEEIMAVDKQYSWSFMMYVHVDQVPGIYMYVCTFLLHIPIIMVCIFFSVYL